jgi:hypothetical protein
VCPKATITPPGAPATRLNWLPLIPALTPHKIKLERHLQQRYGELFGAEFDVLLYDLTST